jgi:hypothetical protein
MHIHHSAANITKRKKEKSVALISAVMPANSFPPPAHALLPSPDRDVAAVLVGRTA